MFDCLECNRKSVEIPLGRDVSFTGLSAVRYCLYLRNLDGTCSECGDGPGYKVELHTDKYVRPIEFIGQKVVDPIFNHAPL